MEADTAVEGQKSILTKLSVSKYRMGQ